MHSPALCNRGAFWRVLEGIDYHGRLLAFFGFQKIVFCVSIFVRRYSGQDWKVPKVQPLTRDDINGISHDGLSCQRA